MYKSFEKSHNNTDMSYRKFTDNATYTLASSMIGLPLGYPIRPYEKKTVDDLLVRKNYAPDTPNLRYAYIIKDSMGSYFPQSLEYDGARWRSSSSLSMLDNFMVNSSIEYSEYMYRCELCLDGINSQSASSRLHEFLFPVYVDISKQHGTALDSKFPYIINGIEMEVSFGRKLPKTLNEFKYDRFFLYERDCLNQNIDGGSGENYRSIRGFDFYKTDTDKFEGEMTRFSRVRKSRGNHTYKHKVTFYSLNELISHGTTMNKLGSGPLCPSYTHADMIYGCQRAMIVPIPLRDEDIIYRYSHPVIYAYPHYIMNSIIPNYPTLYVDFVKPQFIKNQTSLPIFKDDMHCVGFIRLRLWTCAIYNINSGKIQSYDDDNNNGRNSYSDNVREMTNSEAFTVKFRFQKRRPAAMYERNIITGEELYMLPPQIFGVTMNKDKSVSSLVNDTNSLYSYMDVLGIINAGGTMGKPYRAWYSDDKIVFSDLGGWLYPPARLSQLTHVNRTSYMIDDNDYKMLETRAQIHSVNTFHAPINRKMQGILPEYLWSD